MRGEGWERVTGLLSIILMMVQVVYFGESLGMGQSRTSPNITAALPLARKRISKGGKE